jgi:alpha-tubulin suppressor-like RCC1 family protein
VNADTPVEVNLPLPVTRVAQGGSYFGNGQTMVQLSDGSLRSWGSDQSGQLGNDKRVNQPSPIEFSPPPGVSYMLLASGGSTSYAVSTTGDVYAWGFGGAGQIGNGSTATELNPVLVESGVSLISSTAEDVVTQ